MSSESTIASGGLEVLDWLVLAGYLAVMAWLIFATDVNFLWPSTFGLMVSLAVGYGWSLLGRPLGKEKLLWTLREQRKFW